MAVSYPVDIPSSPKPSSVNWLQTNVVAASISPFTLDTQTQEWDGSAWAIEVSIDPMERKDAAPWIAFLTSLHGKKGTFRFGDTLMATPQGTAGGTPLVNGADQTGFTLSTDGWNSSETVLKAGDFIQINTALYMVVEDATTDGGGAVDLEVWPRLRGHANNIAITTSNCVGLFRLVEPTIRAIRAPRSQLYSIDFKAEEAF